MGQSRESQSRRSVGVLGQMKLFRVTYNLRSAVASDWQADTIFGHICWALRYLEGEDKLIRFLSDYELRQPPIIISDGFPGELLPRPLTRPVQDEGEEESIRQKVARSQSGEDKSALEKVVCREYRQGESRC